MFSLWSFSTGFAFDLMLCIIWVMHCFGGAATLLYLWSAILHESPDYIWWNQSYQTTSEPIVAGISHIWGNKKRAASWPLGDRGNTGLTDMEIESKWLGSAVTRSYNPITVLPCDLQSSSKEHFWSIVEDRFVNTDGWVRLSVEKAFRGRCCWNEMRSKRAPDCHLRNSCLYPVRWCFLLLFRCHIDCWTQLSTPTICESWALKNAQTWKTKTNDHIKKYLRILKKKRKKSTASGRAWAGYLQSHIFFPMHHVEIVRRVWGEHDWRGSLGVTMQEGQQITATFCHKACPDFMGLTDPPPYMRPEPSGYAWRPWSPTPWCSCCGRSMSISVFAS